MRKLCPLTLFSSTFLLFWALTQFVAMLSVCDAGSGIWEHLFSEIDSVTLLWVDFCFKFGKGLSLRCCTGIRNAYRTQWVMDLTWGFCSTTNTDLLPLRL